MKYFDTFIRFESMATRVPSERHFKSLNKSRITHRVSVASPIKSVYRKLLQPKRRMVRLVP
jgi:hypothetical protein